MLLLTTENPNEVWDRLWIRTPSRCVLHGSELGTVWSLKWIGLHCLFALLEFSFYEPRRCIDGEMRMRLCDLLLLVLNRPESSNVESYEWRHVQVFKRLLHTCPY